MIASHIGYVAAIVHDVEDVATILARDLGLTRHALSLGTGGRTVPVFPIGRSALALVPPGDAFVNGESRAGLHHVALACDDFTAAKTALRAAGLTLGAAPCLAGFGAGDRFEIPPEQTAGVRISIAHPLAELDRTRAPVERFDHLGVASVDNGRAIEVFCRRLGFALESQQTDVETRVALESFTSDKYGVVNHSQRPEIVGGLRVAFVTVGDCELEFLHDFTASTADSSRGNQPGTTKQDQSAIARFIAARGPGLHHLALKVGDIDGTLQKLARAGIRLIDPVGRPGSRRAKIGFIHPKSLGGLLVHLVERDEVPYRG